MASSPTSFRDKALSTLYLYGNGQDVHSVLFFFLPRLIVEAFSSLPLQGSKF